MSQVTEQSVRFQTALASIKLIQASAVLDLTEDDFDFLTSNKESNIQTGAERMPHDLSHLGFLAGQIGRLITISTTPVIAGDSFEMDAVGALRLSPLRRGLAIDSTVDIFTFYVP